MDAKNSVGNDDLDALDIEIKPERLDIDSEDIEGVGYDAAETESGKSVSGINEPVTNADVNLSMVCIPTGVSAERDSSNKGIPCAEQLSAVPASLLTIMEAELRQRAASGAKSGLVSGSDTHSEQSSQELEDTEVMAAVADLRSLSNDITMTLNLLLVKPGPDIADKLRDLAISARRKIDGVLSHLPGDDEEVLAIRKRVVPETPETGSPSDSERKTDAEAKSLVGDGDDGFGSSLTMGNLEETLAYGSFNAMDNIADAAGENEDDRKALLEGLSDDSADDEPPLSTNDVDMDSDALLKDNSDAGDSVDTVVCVRSPATGEEQDVKSCTKVLVKASDSSDEDVKPNKEKVDKYLDFKSSTADKKCNVSNEVSKAIDRLSDHELNSGDSGESTKTAEQTKAVENPSVDNVKSASISTVKLSSGLDRSGSDDSDAASNQSNVTEPSKAHVSDSSDSIDDIRDMKSLQRNATKQEKIVDSDDEDNKVRKKSRTIRRKRSTRGPTEATKDCEVSLARLSEKLLREANEKGFVKLRKSAKRTLSEQEMNVRRLANITQLLRSSKKTSPSSESEDESDSSASSDSRTRRRRSAPKASSKAKRPEKESRRRVKDMSSGEEDMAGFDSDGQKRADSGAGPSGLLPQQQNDFDRMQLLLSGSSDDEESEDESPSVASDNSDSDFVPEKRKSRHGKDKTADSSDEESGGKSKKAKEENSSGDDKAKTKTEKESTKSKKAKEKRAESDEDEKEKNGKKAKEKGDKSEDSDTTSKEKMKLKKESEDEGQSDSDTKHKSGDKTGDKSDGTPGGSEAESAGEEDEEDCGEQPKAKKKLASNISKLLSGKLSATDSSEEDEKEHEKHLAKKETKEKKFKNGEEQDDEASVSEKSSERADSPVMQPETVELDSSESDSKTKKKSPPKKRRLRLCQSDDSDIEILSEQSDEKKTSNKRSRSSSSSSSSSSDGSADDFAPSKKTTRSKKRLKRIRKMSDDDSLSSAEGGDSDDEKNKSQSTPGKSGRKNIRHIRSADVSTKEASQAELARRKRIEEKQAQYDQLFNKNAEAEAPTKLILDFDKEKEKAIVSVHKNFVKILKPHQIDGVKFMFDSTIETVERLLDEANSASAGCILAHCMGLGKTLQVVVLLHTLLMSSETRQKMSCALVVCPKNTVANWVRELRTWQKKCRVPEVDVVDITHKKDNYERSFELEEWTREGGVCVLSYDMFKRFCGTGGKKGYNKKQVERFQKALIDPGPDIIVCDEGHLLKNPRTAAFKSLNQSKCSRRVILTGTPLQNNLREYHTMVEFVKPRLLGSEAEFSNRFIRPIENGSAVDAQSRDVRLMKRRSHVLHKLLDAVVQRRDYNVLTPFLPPKHEYTVLVKLSEVQRRLYTEYLEKRARSTSRKILPDFQALARVWTHPRCVEMKDEQDEEANELKQEKAAMAKFVARDSESSSDDDDSNGATANGEGAAEEAKPEEEDWWRSCLPEDCDLENIALSGKLSLLDELLIKCENIGDKLLVFSQSLFSLNLIEEHLARLHKEMVKKRNSEQKHRSHVYFGTWKLDYDYFRLDGSTSTEARQQMCDRINKVSNERARLMLISTKAGGLGINLVGANRVVIFDASWNPTADSQAIFRVFRFGQLKPCYIYRFIAQGCMEEKIYDRQISKLSLACRVVDEQQVERHFSAHDVEELYEFEPDRKRATGLVVPKDDHLLMDLVKEQPDWVSSVHGHDSLLQNVEEEELNADEQRAAWEEYENDRRGVPNIGDQIPLVDGKTIDKATVIGMIKKDNPGASDNDVLLMIPRAIQTLRAYYFRKQQEERRRQEQEYVRMLQQQQAAQLRQRLAQAGFPGGGAAANQYSNTAYGLMMSEMAARAQQQAAQQQQQRPDASATNQLHSQLLKRMLASQQQPQQRQKMQPTPGGKQPRVAHVAKPNVVAAAVGGVKLPPHLQVQKVPAAGASDSGAKNSKDGPNKNEKKPSAPAPVVDIT